MGRLKKVCQSRSSRHPVSRTTPELALPTPSVSSASSWTNSSSSLASPGWAPPFAYPLLEDYGMDVPEEKKQAITRKTRQVLPIRRSLRSLRPQMLNSSSRSVAPASKHTFNSSWPFNEAKVKQYGSTDSFLPDLCRFYYFEVEGKSQALRDESVKSLPMLRLTLAKQFPYAKAMDKIKSARLKGKIIFDPSLNALMTSIAAVATGSTCSNLQKQSEVSFCAWTSLLNYCAIKKVTRYDQLTVLAAAATILQAKLMDEAELNLNILLNKCSIANTSTETLKSYERTLSDALKFKLLYPTPHVILFLLMDNLDSFVRVPGTFKIAAGLVLDHLLSNGVVRSLLIDHKDRFGRVGVVVFGILFEIMCELLIRPHLESLSRAKMLQILVATLDLPTRNLLFADNFQFGRDPTFIFPQNIIQTIKDTIRSIREKTL